MDIVDGIDRKDVVEVEDKVPRKLDVDKVRKEDEGIAEVVVVRDWATGAYGPSEPYAPLPGWNNRSCICAVVLSVLGKCR